MLFEQKLNEKERNNVARLYNEHCLNQTELAEKFDVHRKTIYRILKEFNVYLTLPEFNEKKKQLKNARFSEKLNKAKQEAKDYNSNETKHLYAV